jgi:hypothetical protein
MFDLEPPDDNGGSAMSDPERFNREETERLKRGITKALAEGRITNDMRHISFDLDPDDWHGHGAEGIWAEPVSDFGPGAWRLLNSPFFFRGVSYLDIVRGIPPTESAPHSFGGVIKHSGHSTYMILFPVDSKDFEPYWKRLQDLGCTREWATIGMENLYSVDVPPSADIHAVYAILEEGERDGVWEFQEGHCAHDA